MNRLILLTVASIFLLGATTNAQNFRTRQDGNWNNLNTWEQDNDLDGVFETSPAAVVPNGASHGVITILNTHDVTVTANVTTDQTTIDSGGTLTINAGISLRIRTGPGVDLIVSSGASVFVNGIFQSAGVGSNGTVEVFGTIQLNQGGTITSLNAGNGQLSIMNGGIYTHNYTTSAGTIPTADWQSGSTCNISGFTSSANPPIGITQTFHHFTWNCSNQASIIEINNGLNIAGNFIISSTSILTNGGALVFNNTTSPQTLNVTGTMQVTGESYFLLNQSTGTTTATIGGLTVDHADATFDFAESGISIVNLSGNFTWTNGAMQVVGGTAELNFTGTSNQIVTAAFGLSGNLNYMINNNAIVTIPGENRLSGNGTFTIEGNGRLNVGSTHPNGPIQNGTANGNIRVGGSRTFTAGCTIVFSGTAAQIYGSGMPSDVNVVIDNPSGVSLASSSTINTGRTLTFTNGRLSIGSNNTLTINGSVAGMSASNSITGGLTSNLTVGGAATSAGTLFFNQTSNTTRSLNNFTLNRNGGSVTIGNTLRMEGVLTVSDGTLNTSGNVILTSNSATQSAQLGVIGSTGNISGNFVIERFIPARTRGWRFLAAPVTAGSNATIRNNWQSQIFITGGTGGSGPVGISNFNADGFDWTASNNPSMFTYNESAGGAFNDRWVSVGNPTTTNLAAGAGYRVFMRGDRSNAGRLDGTENSQNQVTLSVTGTPVKGPFNLNVTKASAAGSDGWNLLGNPFPATLNFNAFRSTNSGIINNIYYTLNVGGSGYVSWNGTVGAATQFIPSGQAFWVYKTAAGTSSITFDEAHKSTGSTSNGFFKSGITNLLNISLRNLSDSTQTYSFIHYRNDASNAADSFDVTKLSFGLGQLACYNNGSTNYLDINSKHTSALLNTDTVNLFVNQSAVANNYRLIFDGVNSFAGTQVFLHDLFLNSLTNLSGNSTYNFTTNTNSASTGAGRFKLYFAGANSSLPVEYLSFKATKQGEQTLLNWTTAAEVNNSHFEMEKSLDNKEFKSIGLVKGSGTTSMESNYQFVDERPTQSIINYYRIKQVDLNGKFSYSPVLPVDFSNMNGSMVNGSGQNILIYPVPANNILNITAADYEQVNATINIYDIAGSLIISSDKQLDKNTAINIESLSSGIYFIEIVNGSQTLFNSKFIKN